MIYSICQLYSEKGEFSMILLTNYLNGATIAIKDITIAIKHTILFTIIPILDDADDL